MRGFAKGGGVLLAVIAGMEVAAACSGSGVFACFEDGQCANGAVSGVCEQAGFCSFPDPECPSGARYGEHAGNELAGACVEPPGSETDATTNGSASMTSGADGTQGESTLSSSGPDTASGESGSTTGQTLPGCGNGVLDPGEDCDDGNLEDGDGCNAECTPSGQLLWSVVHDGAAGGDDLGAGIAVIDPADGGGLVVAGYETVVGQGRDALVQRYDDDGTLVWSSTVGGADGESDEARAVVVDDGRAWAFGHEGVIDAMTMITQSHRWGGVWELDGTPVDTGAGIEGDLWAAAPYGAGLVVAGHVGGADEAMWVAEVDDSLSVVWEVISPAVDEDEARGVVVDAQGQIFVTGSRGVSAKTDAAVFLDLVTPAGAVNLATDETVFGSEGQGIAVGRNGEIYVGGWERPAGVSSSRDTWLSRYDVDGTLGWTETYVGVAGFSDEIEGVAVASNGDVIAVGFHREDATDEADFWVRRYAPDGAQRWTFTLDHLGGFDALRAVAMADNGDILVTGEVRDATDARDLWVGRLSP